MSNTINEMLINNEQLLARAKFSAWMELKLIVLGIILIPFFGLGLFILLYSYLMLHSRDLVLTSNRIIAKNGLISKNTTEINFNKIESVDISQSLIARILNIGTIKFGGTGGHSVGFDYIENPFAFKKQCDEAISAYSVK